MSTLGTNLLTLLDLAKRLGPDHRVAKVIELLAQTNSILEDMVWMEGNLQTGHRTTVRTGLPQVFWRLLNQGTQPSKSTTAQIDEACGMLEAWAEVDVELAKLSNDIGEFRLSEARAFIEAMNQEMSSTLIYGNSSTAPEEFNGLAVRYASLSAGNGQNIVSGGGSDAGDQMSMYLIVWGENTVHGIYPKGSTAGLQHQDHGEVTVETTAGIAGSRMRALQDQWTWKCGIALRDWRYVVRIANIDKSTLVANSSPADLTQLMTKAWHRIPTFGMGRPAYYANRTALQYLDIQRQKAVKDGGGITYENIDGKIVPHFRGIPIRVCDALLETEDPVT